MDLPALSQLAPQIVVALVIVGAVTWLLREVKKLSGNGKLDALITTVDKLVATLVRVEERLGSLERQEAFRAGKEAGASGAYDAVRMPGVQGPPEHGGQQ